ncbi:MAG: carboxypeptidase-like regulatory domain-containing protein, partial [Terracidiphilus sp.]
MRQAKFRFFLLPLFLVLACVGLYAQANSNVTGIITDQTGAVVAGANITLTDPATGATHATISSGSGLYDVAGLNPANYNLKVTAKGFETYVQSGVVVNVSGTFRVDVKLIIGKESQTVTVEADALTVQADSNVVSTLISGQQITELATNGRNMVSLAELGLGVSSNNPDMNMPSTTGASYSISFNGLQPGHNIWILDGGEAYDRGSGGKMALMPSQDALSEFQVLASNYPADYGISSGGTITMVIKSGTSQLHASGWEFDRNDAFQGHNWFDDNLGQKEAKSELRYNVYGFNVGGPVIIPHVYGRSSKQKTFFFYNEEWRKQVVGQGSKQYNGVPVADAPTTATNTTWVIPAYANADQIASAAQVYVLQVAASSAIGGKLLGDYTGLTCVVGTVASACTAAGANIAPYQAFPGNVIDANLFDSNALLFNSLKNIPTVSNTSTTGQWSPGAGHLPTPIRDDVIRIDHN